jgi:general secretion pathway protein L
MTTLIVTLPSDPTDSSAQFPYVITRDGSQVDGHSSAALSLLPLHRKSSGNADTSAVDEVVALVPARCLSWHALQLPKGVLRRRGFQDSANSRLRAVLDGLMEDRVLDETVQLHFAIAPDARTEAAVWVAVCDRNWLTQCVHVLEQSGRPVSRIVPEFHPDDVTDVVYVTGEPDSAFFVCASPVGVTVLPASTASTALLRFPQGGSLVAQPAVASVAERLMQRSAVLETPAQRSVLAAQSAWDLAQFELTNSQGGRHWKRISSTVKGVLMAPRWRPVRLAFVVLLIVNLVGINAWAWKQRSEVAARKAAIAAVLTGTFPQVKVVVDAPLQMAREVTALERAAGVTSGRDLEAILNTFGSLAPAKTTVTAIEYVAGELRLRGPGLGSDSLGALAGPLKERGYALRVEGDWLILKWEGAQ